MSKYNKLMMEIIYIVDWALSNLSLWLPDGRLNILEAEYSIHKQVYP